MKSEHKIRLVLCDDHDMVREALALFLSKEKNIEVVGSAATEESLLELVKSSNPDIVLLDVRLGSESGVNILRKLREGNTGQNVIMLTTFESDLALVDAYEAGAAAFLLKSAHVQNMLSTIREVADGRRPFDVVEVRAAMARLEATGMSVLRTLDDTDRAILRELAKGASDQQIASAVFLSVQTVRNKVSRLLRRFDRENRTQIAVFLAGLPDDSL
jgi:DNA-binding NarL/FixJ family response regulator